MAVPYPSQGEPEFRLEDPIEPERPFSIDSESFEAPPAPITSEVANQRAFKMKFGLDRILMETKDELFGKINAGEENQLRAKAAGDIDQRKLDLTPQVIQKVIGAKGGPLTPEEALGISSIMQDMNVKTDPASVVEEAYGKQFMAVLDKAMTDNPNSNASKARVTDPEAVARLQAEHSQKITTREYFLKASEDLDAELKNQGWAGFGFDLVKQAVPGYTDYNLRGNISGVGMVDGVFLGENLEEQRKAILRLPTFEARRKAFDAVIEGLKSGVAGGNLQLASQFAQGMVGLTRSQAFIQSAILPLDVSGIGLGKAAVRGAKAVRGGVETSESRVIPKSNWEPIGKEYQEAKKAAEDIATAAADPNVSKSTIEAASGNLKESAVTRAVTDATWDQSSEPRMTEQAVEALTATHRPDMAEARANPGRFGNDIVNRIAEQGDNIWISFSNAVKTAQKVDRIPEIMANELAVRAILDYTKNTYRDLANSVIHMSKPYRENVSTGHYTDMYIGNNDGTYFKSKEVAENFIEAHGLRSAQVGEGKDVAFTKNKIKDDKLTKDIASTQALIAKNQKILDDVSASDAARAKAGEQITIAEEYIVDKAMERHLLQGQKVTVEQQGLGYFVKITKPIEETSSVMRQFIAETTNTKIPDSPFRRFMNSSPVGWLRTPEETLSAAERQNRLTATYTPSIYFDVMKNNAPNLNKVLGTRFGKGRAKRKEFEKVLKAGQKMVDPEAPPGEAGGYYFKSPEELEHNYLTINDRLPDEDEVMAYFEFKRGMEIDRAFRNIAEHRNQIRLGAETHLISTVDDTGAKVTSKEFSGITRGKLVRSDDNILIMGDAAGQERMRSLKNMSVKEMDDLQEIMDAGGYKLIESVNPEHRPLAGFGAVKENNQIRYILAKESEVRELDWNQVARRGGGHMEYDYDYYVKQAKISFDDVGDRSWYLGDTTVMPIQVRAMGVKVANHLNQVRELLLAKQDAAAQAYSNKNLHIDWDIVNGWFKASKDAEGKTVLPRLSLKEPIVVLRRNESISGLDNTLEKRNVNFKDATREGSLGRQNQVEYNRQRDSHDLVTLTDEGKRNAPLYKVAPAELVDPITTMNRGLSRIAKSNFLDDYKTMSVEHWLKQAAPYFNDSKRVWGSPFHYFHNPDWKKDTPVQIRRALETAKLHTEQLTGVPSTTDTLLHSYAQKSYDMLYNQFGPKGLVISPAWMLPKLKDPFGFVRSVVFHAKLGLFNVPQFIVQAGNYSNIYGIAGSKYATPGTYAAQLHFWSTVNSNPAIIKHLDEMAAKMRIPGTSHWKQGEFKEAFEELNKTGFGNVGSEYAILDNPMSEKIIEDGRRKFLDWGTYFFRQGEKNAKYGAWYTAYKEFRDKSPVGRITDADRASILQRADLLNLNMSRASSSAIHQGVWSIPTQFYTYQIRLMELFFGSRIDMKTRARMFATNAAMYGIPMATGLTGIPFNDYIRNKAMENGYIVGENFFSTAMMEGIVSSLGAVASGKGDIQMGTAYDVANRFGTKGLEFFSGLGDPNKSYLDIAGGAAYGMAKSTWESTDGLRRVMYGMWKGDKELYPATYDDGLDVLKEISSIKGINQSYTAYRTGIWTTKKGDPLSKNITPTNAAVNLLLGVKPQQITDIHTIQKALKGEAQDEKKVEEHFTKQFRIGIKMMQTDPEGAQKQFNRARTILEVADFRDERIMQMMNKAINDDFTVLERTNMDKFLKRAPASRSDAGLDRMQRLEQLRVKRGEQ